MLGKVFKAYDIRGTYPDPLNEPMARQIGYGCARFLIASAKAAGEGSPMMTNIVVGRDMRKSSPSLSEAVMRGITDQGGNVLDVGMVDTSFIYFAVNHLDCAGGVMVTASHNPPQYNGMKISKRKAKPVGEQTGLADIRKFAATVDFQNNFHPAGGRVEKRDLWSAYREHVLGFLNLSARKGKKPLKMVIDASNGMAGTTIPKLFGTAKKPTVEGVEIVEVNFDNSKGEFAHEPNPLVAANVRQCCEAVVKHKADVGFCYDGDADRCVVVDEKGHIVGCDHLTALLARHFLHQHKGATIVYDLRSTKAVAEEITKAGGKPMRGRVGHVFMKQMLADHKAVFGGELSGHFYFQQNFNADSGVIAMCVVLTVLAETGKHMSELIKPIARYIQSGEINFQIEDKDAALAKLKELYAKTAAIDELDGVTIDAFAKEGWWANIRKSNTEPLLRLNLEAKDRKTLDEVYAKLSPVLGHKVDH